MAVVGARCHEAPTEHPRADKNARRGKSGEEGLSGWAKTRLATYPRREVGEALDFLDNILLVSIGDGSDDVELDLLLLGSLVPQDKEK